MHCAYLNDRLDSVRDQFGGNVHHSERSGREALSVHLLIAAVRLTLDLFQHQIRGRLGTFEAFSGFLPPKRTVDVDAGRHLRSVAIEESVEEADGDVWQRAPAAAEQDQRHRGACKQVSGFAGRRKGS